MDTYLHHHHHHHHHQQLEFSPIIIGLLGIFAGAIMVATYHCIAGSCCFRRQNGESLPDRHQNSDPLSNQERNSRSRSNASVAMASIPVSSYSKDCNEGMCSVCLSEFNEGERIRVLPECLHLFHVECIDKWLTSHSNCPLCRANIVPPQHSVLTLPDSGENEIPPREFHPVPFGV